MSLHPLNELDYQTVRIPVLGKPLAPGFGFRRRDDIYAPLYQLLMDSVQALYDQRLQQAFQQRSAGFR
ncbi:hypothetical protein LJ754_11205 [Arthrobacter sp. zg-Y40]|uniref:hypothetical protein n=1 Tax=Arthrobacter sp. zg-Y40 TaxID=2886939 RepID=UPI001D13FA3C|nr:hypothetical protein [Arthrobacter sp. zg-Y40]MCC3279718.1 hypothetical protein [Arthrobacter sp. zg-Y40]